MRVLLDENMPHKLRLAFPSHEVMTVADLDLCGIRNGKLLEQARFLAIDVFVTADQSLRYQQNLSDRSLALVVLSSNRWPILKDLFREISDTVSNATTGSYHEVNCGPFK